MADFNFIDRSKEANAALEQAILAALEAVGNQAVTYAKNNVTEGVPRNGGSWYTPTGDLRNKIDHKVDAGEKAVYIGTNVSHAKYNEYGTGIYADGGGKQGFWVFVPGSGSGGVGGAKAYTEAEARRVVAILKSKGLDAHMTNGMKPLHFLKKAAADHTEVYKAIFRKFLQKAW